jgi:hypothetical protein
MGFQPRTNLCKDRNGNLVASGQQVLKIWAEYFKGLLNKDGKERIKWIQYIFVLTLHNCPHNLHGLRYYKQIKEELSAKKGLIKAELIKYGGKELWKCIHNLIMDI